LKNDLKLNITNEGSILSTNYIAMGQFLEKTYKKKGYYTDIIYNNNKKTTPMPHHIVSNIWTHRIHINLYFNNPEKRKLLKIFVEKCKMIEPFNYDQMENVAVEVFGKIIIPDMNDLIDFLEHHISILHPTGKIYMIHPERFYKKKQKFKIDLLPQKFPIDVDKEMIIIPTTSYTNKTISKFFRHPKYIVKDIFDIQY
jgi:hypothetical protein